MKVELIKDITNEKGQIRETVRKNRNLRIVWQKGAILDMSEASAAKWIEAGYARLVDAGKSK